MRRKRQQITDAECEKLLTEERRGVLSVLCESGYPYALPLNFYYEKAERTIYFHCAREGQKLDAIRANDKVCFTVMDAGEKRDGDWAYYVRSVVIFGRATLVTEEERKSEKLRRLGEKYFPTAEELEEELRRSSERAQMVAIKIEHMTGKLVHEK